MTCIYIGIRGLSSLLKTCLGRMITMCECFVLNSTVICLRRRPPKKTPLSRSETWGLSQYSGGVPWRLVKVIDLSFSSPIHLFRVRIRSAAGAKPSLASCTWQYAEAFSYGLAYLRSFSYAKQCNSPWEGLIERNVKLSERLYACAAAGMHMNSHGIAEVVSSYSVRPSHLSSPMISLPRW